MRLIDADRLLRRMKIKLSPRTYMVMKIFIDEEKTVSVPNPGHEDSDDGEKEKQMDRDAFLRKAKRLGARALNDMVSGGYDLNEHDMYIVWYCKALQNWKALIFTDVLYDNQDVQIPYYVEVTYNGDKHEAYCDVYLKQKNFWYPDGDAK